MNIKSLLSSPERLKKKGNKNMKLIEMRLTKGELQRLILACDLIIGSKDLDTKSLESWVDLRSTLRLYQKRESTENKINK